MPPRANNAPKISRVAFQKSALQFSTPSKPDLSLSLIPAADGAPVYFAPDAHSSFSWAEAESITGHSHSIESRSRHAGIRSGLPAVLEHSVTFVTDRYPYLRVSGSAWPSAAAASLGISCRRSDGSIMWVAISSSRAADGSLLVKLRAAIDGKSEEGSFTVPKGGAPSQGSAGATELENLIKKLGLVSIFSRDFHKAGYLGEFLSSWRAAKSNKSSKLPAKKARSQAAPTSGGTPAPRAIFITAGSINATNAEQIKEQFAAEFELNSALLGGSESMSDSDSTVYSFNPLELVWEYIGHVLIDDFNGFVDQLVAAQQAAAELAQAYATDASGYAQQSETYADEAQQATDAVTAQQDATLAQQYADLAVQNATQAVTEAGASGGGATAASQAALDAAQAALTSAQAALSDAQQAQDSADTLQSQDAADESGQVQADQQAAETADQDAESTDEDQLSQDDTDLSSDDGN